MTSEEPTQIPRDVLNLVVAVKALKSIRDIDLRNVIKEQVEYLDMLLHAIDEQIKGAVDK